MSDLTDVFTHHSSLLLQHSLDAEDDSFMAAAYYAAGQIDEYNGFDSEQEYDEAKLAIDAAYEIAEEVYVPSNYGSDGNRVSEKDVTTCLVFLDDSIYYEKNGRVEVWANKATFLKKFRLDIIEQTLISSDDPAVTQDDQ